MAQSSLPPVPFQAKMLNSDGHLTSVWSRWFWQLLNQVSSLSDSFTNPMTSLGDMIFGGTGGSVTRLAGNLSTTKMFLTQTGTGSLSSDPSWGEIDASDIPTLNQDTTGTAGSLTQTLLQDAVVIGNGTGISALGTLGSAGQILTSNGATTSPSWQNAPASGALAVYGTRPSPIFITATAGITSEPDHRQLIRIRGSGGAVTITASPAISAGIIDGQELILEGSSAGSTVTINDGTGLEQGGVMILGTGDKIAYLWNSAASVWTETWRFYAGITGGVFTDNSGNPFTDNSGNTFGDG